MSVLDGDEKVNELEITYIDPATSSACCRQVHCDPEGWHPDRRGEARLLVSSDLVNSLSEATGIWFQRFRQLHQRLEDSRSGYYFELFSLRQQMQRLPQHSRKALSKQSSRLSMQSSSAASSVNPEQSVCSESRSASASSTANPEEEEAHEPANEEQKTEEKEETKVLEAFAVHFFNPELYIDSWTKEMLQKAIKSFRDQLTLEISIINERITVIGAGTWRQLLAFFLKNGTDPIELVIGLLHAIEDPTRRRELINTITNGLQDLYDALLAKLEGLQEESDDMVKRSEEIEYLGRRQRQAIADIQKQMVEDGEQLSVPGFEEPPEEDDTEAVAEAQAKMFGDKENGLKEYGQRVKRFRQQLEEWKARLEAECDMEAIHKLEEEVKDWKRKTRGLQMRSEKQNEAAEAVEERASKIEEKISKQKEASDALKEKLASVPSINPATLKMKKLERQLKELERDAKKMKQAMAEPSNRIKAMRAQLKVLYQKLGWEWDLSDSEDEDGDEKPYWRRRKIAQDGFLPFNQRDFLYEEKSFKQRRKKRLTTTLQIEQESLLIARMKAKRHQIGQEAFDLGDQEAGPNLFGVDERSRDPDDPVQRAISAARELIALPGQRQALLETPCWKRAQKAQEREFRQVQLSRLVRLRESFEVQMQQCVECFAAMLPRSGSLGDLRARLAATLTKFRNLSEDPEASETRELECELQAACESLQSMIQEAIDDSDQVQPIFAAMNYSVKLSDLKVSLFEVLQSEHEIRGALKALGISRRHELPSNDESPPMTPSSRLLLPESSNSSARLRGLDGGSDGGFSANAGGNSRGMPYNDVSDDSLGNSRRFLSQSGPLMAQSTPWLSSSRRPKTDTQKRVDFGFRPDGAGEDSLENWSLFKVNKGSTATSGFGDSVSTGLGLTTSSGHWPSSSMDDKMRKTETKVRRQRAAVDCDFHEYMSQAHQMSEAAWRSGSAPNLLAKEKKKKNLPHLPKLVKIRSQESFSRVSSSDLAKGAMGKIATWERSPPRISVPSITVPSKKFGATAPNALFTKW